MPIKKPIIYEKEFYLFKNLTITGIWKMLDGFEFDITVGMNTPEYKEIFGNAWFHMEVPSLIKIMSSIQVPNANHYREKFWKLFYEVSENVDEEAEWEIGSKQLISELGSLPVIDSISIIADVDIYDYDLNNKLDTLEFNIIDTDYQIQALTEIKSQPFKNRDLGEVANDICLLAQYTGYDLLHVWDFLNKLRNSKFINDKKNKQEIADMIHEVHIRLIKWDREMAQKLDRELLKHM